MDSGLSSRINLVILDRPTTSGLPSTPGSDEIRKQVRLVALFGRDRRVGECLLLREERKSGLRGPISVFDPDGTFLPDRPIAIASSDTTPAAWECQGPENPRHGRARRRRRWRA